MTLAATATQLQENDPPASAPLFVDVISEAGPTAYGTDVWNKAHLEARLKTLHGADRTIVAIIPGTPSATYYAEYDPINDAILAYVRTTGVENATADIHTVIFPFTILSK